MHRLEIKQIQSEKQKTSESDSVSYIQSLGDDSGLNILGYLNRSELRQIAQVDVFFRERVQVIRRMTKGLTLENHEVSNTGCLITVLKLYPNLESLNLFRVAKHVEDSVLLGPVARMVKLKHLNLAFSVKITEKGLVHIKKLTQLLSLDLDDCINIGDKGLEYIQGLTQLRNLSLDGCIHISNQGLRCFREMKKLRDLNLSRCEITKDGLANLKDLKDMQILSLDGCTLLDDRCTPYINSMEGLKVVHIRGCHKFLRIGIRNKELRIQRR